jgi:hypothetical protein
MSRTHDLGEWAAFLSLGVGVWASWAALMWLLTDAHREDFPRLWQAAVHARHDFDRTLASLLMWIADAALYARVTSRDAALTAAALLALLLPATETTS